MSEIEQLVNEVVADARQHGQVECNGVLVRRGDEWSFRLEFDNGLTVEQDETYETQEQARLGLGLFLQKLGVSERMRAQ